MIYYMCTLARRPYIFLFGDAIILLLLYSRVSRTRAKKCAAAGAIYHFERISHNNNMREPSLKRLWWYFRGGFILATEKRIAAVVQYAYSYCMIIKIYNCLRSRSPEPSVFNGTVTKVIYFKYNIIICMTAPPSTAAPASCRGHIIIIIVTIYYCKLTLQYWAHYVNRVRPNNAVFRKKYINRFIIRNFDNILAGSSRYNNAHRTVNCR